MFIPHFKVFLLNFIFILQVKEKARALAEQFCEKNGAYRMPFAWTAIHLVDIITGANAGESNTQGSNEQLSKDNGGKNNVRKHFKI